MCKFSVIVPVYNVENELNRCIDSILKQSVEDFELILIDDGSTDKSGHICDEYGEKDKRVKVIHKKNGGVSSARNIGLDVARGEYIVFVDSDDYVTSEYLEKLYNPSVDMVICSIKHVKINKKNYVIRDNELYGFFEIGEKIINKMIESSLIGTVYSKMYHRKIINNNNIRFKKNINLGEDTIFIIDYMRKIKNLEVKKDVVYNYISYERETLSTFNENTIDNLEYVDEYMENNLLNYYKIQPGEELKKRKWSKYEWAICEVINSKKMNIKEKRKLLKKVFKNKNYIELVKNIDRYMPNDTQIVRNVLSTRNTNFVMLFFFICNLKSKIVSSDK